MPVFFSFFLFNIKQRIVNGHLSNTGSKKKDSSETLSETCISEYSVGLHNVPLLQLNVEQQTAGLQLTHHVSSLLCLLSTQATALESVRSDLMTEIRAASSLGAAPMTSGGQAAAGKSQQRNSHNHRLEELRNLQVIAIIIAN